LLGGLSPAAAAEIPTFAVHTADGATIIGPLDEITQEWGIRLGGSKPVRVQATAVVSLRCVGQPLPPWPRGPQVVLANGSRLPGEVVQIANDRLHLRPALPLGAEDGKPWCLPLSGVLVAWQAAPAGAARPEDLLRRLASEPRTRDVVWLRNGDRIEGTLAGLSDRTLRIKGEGDRVIEVLENRWAVIAFNTELVSRARPRGIYGHLVLAGGGRVVVASGRLRHGEDVLRAKLPTGTAFTIPLDEVRALDLRQGCAVYLSDLKPTAYRHTPFFGLHWPYVVDRSVANHGLRLAGNTYDKGLGLHSQSRLTYPIPDGCRRFEALVGLDDRTGRRGRVRIGVWLDGKPVDIGWNKELTANDRPVALSVDVAGKRQITLAIDFGRFGDVQGHVNWADARFIKGPR
jgi:hypothetical protein